MKKITFLPAVAFPPATPWRAGAKAVALLLISFLFFTACNNDKQQIEKLTKENNETHDTAMKELADMNRLARELKLFMISATMTPEQSAVYNDALTTMGRAENDMMDWMKNAKSTDEMPPAEAITYLQEQKKLIEKNLADIKAAMEAGKKLQSK